MEIKNICCIGSICWRSNYGRIADKCPNLQIEVVDLNEDRIKNWNNSDLTQLPIYEPGLANIVKRRRGKNSFFQQN